MMMVKIKIIYKYSNETLQMRANNNLILLFKATSPSLFIVPIDIQSNTSNIISISIEDKQISEFTQFINLFNEILQKNLTYQDSFDRLNERFHIDSGVFAPISFINMLVGIREIELLETQNTRPVDSEHNSNLIRDLKEQINHLNNEIEQISEQYESMEKRKNELEQRIKELSEQISIVKEKLEDEKEKKIVLENQKKEMDISFQNTIDEMKLVHQKEISEKEKTFQKIREMYYLEFAERTKNRVKTQDLGRKIRSIFQNLADEKAKLIEENLRLENNSERLKNKKEELEKKYLELSKQNSQLLDKNISISNENEQLSRKIEVLSSDNSFYGTNWRLKYLDLESENQNLKEEISKLKKQLYSFSSVVHLHDQIDTLEKENKKLKAKLNHLNLLDQKEENDSKQMENQNSINVSGQNTLIQQKMHDSSLLVNYQITNSGGEQKRYVSSSQNAFPTTRSTKTKFKEYRVKDKGRMFYKYLKNITKNRKLEKLGLFKDFTLCFDPDNNEYMLIIFLKEYGPEMERLNYPETRCFEIIIDQNYTQPNSWEFDLVENDSEKERIPLFYFFTCEPFLFSNLTLSKDKDLKIDEQNIENFVHIENNPCIFFSSDNYFFIRFREILYRTQGYIITPPNITIIDRDSDQNEPVNPNAKYLKKVIDLKNYTNFSYRLDEGEPKKYEIDTPVKFDHHHFEDAFSEYYPIISDNTPIELQLGNFDPGLDEFVLCSCDSPIAQNREPKIQLNSYLDGAHEKKFCLKIKEIGQLPNKHGMMEISYNKGKRGFDRRIPVFRQRFRVVPEEFKCYWMRGEKQFKEKFFRFKPDCSLNVYKGDTIIESHRVYLTPQKPIEIEKYGTFFDFTLPVIRLYQTIGPNTNNIELFNIGISCSRSKVKEQYPIWIEVYYADYLKGDLYYFIHKTKEIENYRWRSKIELDEHNRFEYDLGNLQKEIKSHIYQYTVTLWSKYYSGMGHIFKISPDISSDMRKMIGDKDNIEMIKNIWRRVQ